MPSDILALIALIIASLALISRYRGGYLAELINSFLPYSVLISVLLLLVGSLLVGELSTTKILLLLVGWLSAVLLGGPLFNFAYFGPLGGRSKTSNLRVASFNKLFTNDNIEGIFYHAQHLQVDVVGILELKSEQSKQLAKLAKHHKLYFTSHRYSA